MSLACCFNANARVEKTSFDWSKAKVEWNADATTFDASTKTIFFESFLKDTVWVAQTNEDGSIKKDNEGNTMFDVKETGKRNEDGSPVYVLDENGNKIPVGGNGAVSWYDGVPTDISIYDRLVLELEEPTTANIEVVVSNGGFWGQYSSNIMEAGNTKLSLTLADLKITDAGDNDKYKRGDAVGLNEVNMIYIRTGWTEKQVIKVKDFYFEKDITGYDVIDKKDVFARKYFNVGDSNFNKNDVGNRNTVDIENNSFAIGSGFGSVTWAFPEGLDISDYTKMVFKGTVKGNNVMLRVFDDATEPMISEKERQWNAKEILNNENAQEFTFELNKDIVCDDSHILNKKNIKNITFWNFWDCYSEDNAEKEAAGLDIAHVSVKIDEFYIEKPNGTVKYLTRENLTSDKFGTICLPFTATKPENAYIYNVKGVDSKDAPKTLYIEEAETLEAGKAYIFQSTNNQDIVFTKTGGEEVTEPIKNEALTGVFDGTESVPAGEKSYILKNGEWRYVPQNNNNTVAKYRAYLNLNNAEVISETSAAKYTRMQVNGGGTTGINVINAAAENDNTTIYNLNGVKVANPTKGIYIKNGKKLIIK